MSGANLAGHLQRFFTDRLLGQLDASPHTVASYRYTFRLLLKFTSSQCKRPASDLRVEELDSNLLGAFLKHLENDRSNCVRSRNNRLCAIRAFFGYVCLHEPAVAGHCQRVLAIPLKRSERKLVEFLTATEATAILNAPDAGTWLGHRDRVMLEVAVQTGLRNSEIRRLQRQDVELGTGAHVRCLGKGRKNRCTPLRSDVALRLGKWLQKLPADPTKPVFPTEVGAMMSSDAFQRLVAKHSRTARGTCDSLREKRVTPHTLRHTTAMDLLHRGVDITVIALWLGHESIQTTQIYLHADMALKEKALARTTPRKEPIKRFRPPDRLLAFLESL